MPQVCFYFQLHQPYRLSNYSIFDVSNHASYFDDANQVNKSIFQKVAKKSYYPMLTLLKKLLDWHPDFRFALSCSGVFLEQAEEYEPGVITLLQELVATGRAELLAETYYHSLAALYSPTEFKQQVYAHLKKIDELFGVTPRVFRNTELVYSNKIAQLVAGMRFKGMLTEAVPRYLGDRDKTKVYVDLHGKLPLLLKHAELSDDVAFRFSDKNWNEYPLSVDTYLDWMHIYPADHLVNLFMDFETFGEHQWEDTGIFKFFEVFIDRFLKKEWNSFTTPEIVFDQVWTQLKAAQTTHLDLPIYDVPKPISWADVDRDLTAWIDNPLQQDTLAKIYGLEKKVLASKDALLIHDWRRLQTSDHFYYMCTKWSADGDVHAYFSPYESPFEAYRRFAIVLTDFEQRVG
jgi:alpha-amylase